MLPERCHSTIGAYGFTPARKTRLLDKNQRSQSRSKIPTLHGTAQPKKIAFTFTQPIQRRRTSLSTSTAANKHSLGLSNKHKPLDSCASTYNKNNITKNTDEHLSKAVPKLQNKTFEKQSSQFVGDLELDNSLISSCTSDITNSLLDLSLTPEKARFSSNDSKPAISPISTLNDSGFIDNQKMSSSNSQPTAVKLGMPTSFSSQKLETDTLSIEQWAAEQYKKSLIPMKEDLAEWITSIFHKYKIEHYALSPDTLISQLANGQVLCRLAQTFSQAHKNTPKSPVFSLRKKSRHIFVPRQLCKFPSMGRPTWR